VRTRNPKKQEFSVVQRKGWNLVRTSCDKKIRFNLMGIKEFLVKLGFYKTRFLMIFLGVLCKKGKIIM
jgi:hypothetical protein